MSVLLNITMPKTCEVCPCNDDNWKCNVLDRVFDYETMYEKRFDDCPLIELPPHSDLVDRNKLLAEYDRQHKGPAGVARRIMEQAEAVIEAEGRDG